MDFRGKKYERGSNWSDPEVVELLQLWADQSVQIELESCLRNQHVFNRIADALREKGILRTGDQCREKIKKMKIEYRRIKDNQKTIRGGRTWRFYEVMDRVLSNRPSITYSSLGGTVIANQVLQGAAVGSDGFGLHNIPAQASGGFLFGPPPKQGDLLEIKCEDVDSDDCLLSSDPPAPELLYQICTTGDPDVETKSPGLEQEDPAEMGRGGRTANAALSPSDCSDQNMAGSSGTGWSMTSCPRARGDDGGAEEARDGGGSRGPEMLYHRKRRRQAQGRGSCSNWGRNTQGGVLVRLLNWHREVEERLLALEEARIQREVEAEERRERLEQQRAEQDRQHELRLLSVFTSAITAIHSGSGGAPGTSHTARELFENSELPSRRPEEAQHSMYLSRRGNSIRQHKSILQEGFNLYHGDKQDVSDNPEGIINMGTSENKLCYDLLSKRLTQADMVHVEPSLLQYPDWKGHRFLREEVARFLSDFCKSPSPLKADNVVVMNGCGSLFSSISAVLCDPGDAVLVPTPFYGVITEDVLFYSGVKIAHLPLDCEPHGSENRPFQLTVGKLEKALEDARAKGVCIRVLILMNPHNPLGDIYSAEEMRDFLEFAKRHGLHTIVDEVYMLSTFEESATFPSVLGFSRLPDAQRTHVLWGVSKDFAVAGIRVGIVYSENRDLVEALDQLASFHGVSGTTQYQVARVLQDRAWITQEFLPENRARMLAAHHYVTEELRCLGVPYLHRPAGFFIWADFRKYLPEQTFKAELCLWKHFLRHKVLLSCGQAFHCSTPGWFRIVFTDREPCLRLGIARIRRALEEKGSLTRPLVTEPMRTEKHLPNTEDSRDAGAEEVTAGREQVLGSKEQSSQDDGLLLAADDLVLTDMQADQSAGKLEDLIDTLRQQIRSSDWLEKNTPELSSGEDPDLLSVFKDLLEKVRK